ncbi:hypothetical protein BDV26DRAFT_275784 [Aspergillus bertholletiae]|uniref:Uncharacterized protein n=1 Tax=Aspergillus bertholletiae TaxID=1226010 RepID=A0A5N7AQK3_9EURO|nr:hypothetical protein BDV26DRAFT_275784 [Aspergillus bertholletiae]
MCRWWSSHSIYISLANFPEVYPWSQGDQLGKRATFLDFIGLDFVLFYLFIHFI